MIKVVNHILLFFGVSFLFTLILVQIIPFSITIILALLLSSLLALYTYKHHAKVLEHNYFFFILIFAVIIFTPFVGAKEDNSLEKRNLKEFPEWRWSNVWKFFKEYQVYFDDRFTYRNQLIDFYGRLKYDLIDATNLTSNVAIGDNKWLFYSEADYLKKTSNPFTAKELQRINYNLTLITEWFAQRGINYYYFIAPVKSRIYTEHLPDYMKVRTHYSRYEQLKNYLLKNRNENFITCDKELLAAKKDYDLYYKTDTHWNEVGAYIGYSKIINVLKEKYPQLIPFNINEFKIEKTELYSGDLLSMLGYKTRNPTYQYIVSHTKEIAPTVIFSAVLPDNPENVFEVYEMPNDTNNLNLFVVRDSYSENLKKYLSLNFKKSSYEWKPQLPISKIIQEQPNIVVHEMLDRFTFEYLELPPEIKNDTTFLNQYDINDY